MERTPVVSSTILSVGYDPETYVLEVEFVGGNIYLYYDVPEPVYREFIGSGSLGAYLNSEIRPNYRYTRI